MARSRIQQRQEAERARAAAYDATLRKPRAETRLDTGAIARVVVSGLRERMLRDPATWPGRIKSKDPGKVALAIARHAFARYPVPAHLERIWLGLDGLSPKEAGRRKLWYVDVAQGGSLYKLHTRDLLSRRETHVFLDPPARLGFEAALWHAVARTYTEDPGVALRIARSRIATKRLTPFWRDVARFFAVNPAPLNVMDDLCDFLAARHAEQAGFSLKGRTLGSVVALMEAWHRDLARIRRVGEGSWAGSPLPDWEHAIRPADAPHKAVTWSVRQIRTGRDLAEEGNRMRHCVYTYREACMSGRCSIWALRATTWEGERRHLTIELDARRRVVQIRGLANRLAKPVELDVLRRWAIAHDIEGVR